VRRIILLAAVTAVALLVGGFHQWSAHADEAFSPITCGQNSGKFATSTEFTYQASGSLWRWTWQQNCGGGGTSENEVQRLSLTGGIWQDLVDHICITGDNGCGPGNQTVTITASSSGLGTCNANRTYRSGEWDAEFQNHSVTYLHPDGHGGGNPGC
jgi:hypothetical protein